jgi:hypothetical protein
MDLFKGSLSGIKSLLTFRYQTDRESFWIGEIAMNIKNG